MGREKKTNLKKKRQKKTQKRVENLPWLNKAASVDIQSCCTVYTVKLYMYSCIDLGVYLIG